MRSNTVFVAVCLAALPIAAAAGDITLERRDDRVIVRDDGELFTEYRFEERRPCFFPVLDATGRQMTRRWPLVTSDDTPESKDHPHHTGIWYAHGDVRLEGTTQKADFWHRDCVAQQRFVDFEAHAGEDMLVTENVWRSRNGTTLCTDQRRIMFGSSNGERWIDFEIRIAAPKDRALVLGDTKEGTMAIRVPETMTMETADKGLRHLSKGHITTSADLSGRDAWGTRAKWCAYHGPVDGSPAVIAIFDHPENPRHPTWWMARSYGLFAANGFGRSFFEKTAKGSGDFRIPPGTTATFRYRILFRAAAFEPQVIEERYNTFATQK